MSLYTKVSISLPQTNPPSKRLRFSISFFLSLSLSSSFNSFVSPPFHHVLHFPSFSPFFILHHLLLLRCHPSSLSLSLIFLLRRSLSLSLLFSLIPTPSIWSHFSSFLLAFFTLNRVDPIEWARPDRTDKIERNGILYYTLHYTTWCETATGAAAAAAVAEHHYYCHYCTDRLNIYM